ncbi:MAG: hypothetical protein IJR70_08925 [Eubacterium sp.]|nr:hypothetical protein [Eubacterium sp.]
MKYRFKKHMSLLLAGALALNIAILSIMAYAFDDVELNEDNFPDANFRAAIALMYDIDSDGILTSRERSTQTMTVSGMIEMLAFELDVDEDSLKVNDLKGIEYFENLKTIRCSSIGTIESLDVSSLSALEVLTCNDLGLKSLDVSGNSALRELSVCSNEIEELNLDSNVNLTRLHCYTNPNLTELDLSNQIALADLRCDYCHLSELDLSNNVNLEYINCSYNYLTKLDLSNNTKLVSDGRAITEYNIGHQQTTAFVQVKDGMIVVPMDLANGNVASTSLDVNENVSFADGYFFTDDFDNMKNGIDYSYNTGISDTAFLTVHIDVIENEHAYGFADFDFESNEAIIKCLICKDEYRLDFEDAINSRENEDEYSSFLDVTQDGIINAKDFAAIINEYK